MNAKQYTEQMKQLWKTPKMWAIAERCNHFQAVEDGDIDKLDEIFLDYLKDCKSWDDVEDIARIFIIG